MVSPKQLHRLATNPHDLMRFQATGKLPSGIKPDSPLIRLLESIEPALRLRILGLRVDASLGYQGSRIFANAEQALSWAKPSNEVFGSFPAEAWRIKMFTADISVVQLIANSASAPEKLSASPKRRPRP
ncbi:hypothetical protein ABIC83_002695 [Roseateles asaccharophilus]|uniref:hypothetical protein n=1 Tax=Roseateles asaccharophilus TaxID=582607 RepID=UPI0038372E25